jgi:CysZ protein
MVFALARAFANLFAPALRRVVGLSVALAAASYVVLWVAVAIVLDHSARFAWRPLDWLVDLMGTLAVIVLSWLMFPAVVMGLTILVNLFALPVYLLMPGINFFVFLGLNGYLFGREYFEVVALRRLDRTATGAARQRFAGRVYLGGVVIAGLFIVPLVNLVAPVIATAFMVHLFEDLRRLEPQLLAS